MKDPRPPGPPLEPGAASPALAPAPAPRWACAPSLLGSAYALCVVGSLLVYGLWQERIMSQPYADVDGDGSGDIFTFSVLVVLFTRVVGLAFALVMVVVTREPLYCQAPLWKYMLVSVPTVVASICQFEALRYVSFTMQILGKSFKTVLLMLGLRVCMGTQYKILEWMVAAGVTSGVVFYMAAGPLGPEHGAGSPLWGLGLLTSFIVLDGASSLVQDKLLSEYRNTKYNQLLHNNVTSAVLSLGIWLMWGKSQESLEFCKTHPAVYTDALIMSASAIFAQWFIHVQVQDFGRLAFAATFNLRQIVSVLASYFVYRHAITGPQIAGLSIVFAVLAFQSFAGWMYTREEQRPLLTRADTKAPQSGASTTAILLKRSGLGACLPCTGGRDREAV